MKTLYDFPSQQNRMRRAPEYLPVEGKGFRIEQKYLCSFPEMQEIRVQLAGVMERDPHTGPDGTYLIRSVYFDTPENLCMQQNEDGVDERSKWRIRCYNTDPSVLDLECKYKIHGMTRKEFCRISREEFPGLMRGPYEIPSDPDRPVLNQFRYLQKSMGFRPAVIVEYQREPFVCRFGNVRITRDFALESSKDFGHFFDHNIVARPVLPKGQELLEIKYDDFLPEWLRSAVQTREMQQTAFSKYYLCRRYGFDGNHL